MIDTVIVEVPNPGHPYGVRGVGETSICPPLAAIANAVSAAAGVRLHELPMSPPRILEALGAARRMVEVNLWSGLRPFADGHDGRRGRGRAPWASC